MSRPGPYFFVEVISLCFAHGGYIDKLATVTTFGEHHDAVDEGIDGVILTQTYVQTGMVYGATLALDDVTGFGKLTAKDFHTKSLAF